MCRPANAVEIATSRPLERNVPWTSVVPTAGDLLGIYRITRNCTLLVSVPLGVVTVT